MHPLTMAMQFICILYTMLWRSRDAMENNLDIEVGEGQTNLTSRCGDPVYMGELPRLATQPYGLVPEQAISAGEQPRSLGP